MLKNVEVRRAVRIERVYCFDCIAHVFFLLCRLCGIGFDCEYLNHFHIQPHQITQRVVNWIYRVLFVRFRLLVITCFGYGILA